MSRDKSNTSTTPYNLASLIRGLYGRVARKLKVDPSYVSRVARGERRSGEIEESLERELKRIMALVRTNRNGTGRNSVKRTTAKRKSNKKPVRIAAD
jgi:hypothetical protein